MEKTVNPVSYDELQSLAEEIRLMIVGETGVTLADYIEKAESFSISKLGYRQAKSILTNNKMVVFFPSEVFKIIKDKITQRENFFFNDDDLKFLSNNRQKGSEWLATRFFTTRKNIRDISTKHNIQFKHVYRQFTETEDKFILGNIDKGCTWIAVELNREVSSVRGRFKRIQGYEKNKIQERVKQTTV